MNPVVNKIIRKKQREGRESCEGRDNQGGHMEEESVCMFVRSAGAEWGYRVMTVGGGDGMKPS